MAEQVGLKDSIWLRRLSRRRVLGTAALGGASLAAAAIIGCGEEEKPTATTAPTATSARPASPATTATPQAQQPKRGGTLSRVAGLNGFSYLSGFDPHILNGAYTGAMGLFYQNPIRYHPITLEFEPELAARWEQPSETRYVFKLVPNIKWHTSPP